MIRCLSFENLARDTHTAVFITTSTFAAEAREYGRQVSDSIVLVDGATLTRLMIDNKVGVSHYRSINVPRVDTDYFEQE